MARPREELHEQLKARVPDGMNVYFQPPTNVRMKYPCLRYSRNGATQRRGNNTTYTFLWRYTLVLIGLEDLSGVVETLCELQHTTHTTDYIADGLYHHKLQTYF